MISVAIFGEEEKFEVVRFGSPYRQIIHEAGP